MVTRRKFVKASGATAALIAGLGISGCTTTTTTVTAESPVSGGTLKYGMPSMHANIDIRSGSTIGGPPTWCSCLEGLYGFDDQIQLEPLLAENIDTTDGGYTWEFELRDGVKFHDGSTFDADDLVTQLNWFAGNVDNGYNAKYRSYFGHPYIDDITKVDSTMVTMHMTAPRLGLEYQFARLYPSMIISQEAMLQTDPIDWPIGTGPYMITEITPGEYVKLEPFDDYWGTDNDSFWAGPAYLDAVEVHLYSDETARLAALETGEIDVAIIVNAPSVAVVNSMSGVELLEVPWFTYAPAGFNNRNAPWTDIRFREAVSKGVDWQGLCDVVWPGQPRCWDVCASSPWEYSGDAESLWPEYDFDTAKSLVEEMDDESPLRTINLVKVTGRAGDSVAELVKTEFDNLGIPNNLMVTESSVATQLYRNEIYPPDGYDMLFQLFHASAAEDFDWVNVYYGNAGISSDARHYGGLDDATLNTWVDEWRSDVSESRRQEIADDMQEHIASNMYHVPLVYQMTRAGYQDNVKNLRLAATFRHTPLPYTRVWKT